MGKASRVQRRQLEKPRRLHPELAAVADRADQGVEAVVERGREVLAEHGLGMKELRLEVFDRLRRRRLEEGYRWPEWCYLPGGLVTVGFATSVGLAGPDRLPPRDVWQFGMSLTALAAWLPGRIAVRFDPDLLAELTATPLTGDIPSEIIHRLPAWGLYLDCPHLGEGVGVFACLETDDITRPDGSPMGEGCPDELWLAFILPIRDGAGTTHGAAVTPTSIWIEEGSLADALAAQEVRASEPGDVIVAGRKTLSALFDRPWNEILSSVLSMLLYLCSQDADLSRQTIPPGDRRSRFPIGPRADIPVVSAGYRLGAALREARAARTPAPDGVSTGKRVAPHLRAAHWHSYWVGPMTNPVARHLELRWLPPIPVNTDIAGSALTVVRPVRTTPEVARS